MILSPVLRQRFLDSNGNPLAGGKVYSYIAGTSTPLVTYSDTGGTTNTNPVVLNANGEADIWLDPAKSYKVILKDSLGVTQWTVDQVAGPGLTGVPGWSATVTYSQGDTVRDASGAGVLYVSLQDNNVGNALSVVAYWRVYDGAVRTITASDAALVTDNLVRSDSTSANVTVTLPACSTTPVGKEITVKDVGTGGHSTTVRGAGTDTVDGSVTYGAALKANDWITVQNMGTRWDVKALSVVDASIVTAKMADASVTQAKMAARTTGTTVAAGGVGISASCGTSYANSSSTPSDVTNLSVTITTTGRPVKLMLIGDGTSASLGQGAVSLGIASGSPGYLQGSVWFLRDSTVISRQSMRAMNVTTVMSVMNLPGSAYEHVDTPAAGTYTYKIQANGEAGSITISLGNLKLVAYEL